MMSDRSTPSRIAKSSANSSVAANVVHSTRESAVLARTMVRIWCVSMMPHAARNRMPAIAGIGRCASSGATTSTRPISSSPARIAATGVRAPASAFTALRLNDPVAT